ncbi:MAG: hypothetical protein AB8F78_13890 [Saprospiraceae bacterium]
MLLRLTTLFIFGLLVACTGAKELAKVGPVEHKLKLNGPAVVSDWMHSPLRSENDEPVSFTVQARSAAGIDKVELFVYEYELFSNQYTTPSQRERLGGLSGKVRTWDYKLPVNSVTLEHTHGLGFSKHSRVEYIWRIINVDGEITDRFAMFDAGESPWPEDKVLLYSASRSSMADVIDIAFFRDVDYKDSIALYNQDLDGMIQQGFFGSEVISQNREHWSFYTTDRKADGKAIAEDVSNDALIPEFLKDFSIPGIDAFCLMHREEYTDRSLLLENFHTLSNNLFSAEAYNWGTAVHECGHAIFHLSDEYTGCACFQNRSSSNVFREQADCMEWNIDNGFPAADCYAVADIYDRDWWSAEEPTFFKSEGECREHNRKNGVDGDSCRTFINTSGEELFWAFESTCIMHDDGDHIVRPFQRACSKVILEYFDKLRPGAFDDSFAASVRENIYGYEDVVVMEMGRDGDVWDLQVKGARLGVPTQTIDSEGEVVMRIMGSTGESLYAYGLSQPGAVHVHDDAQDRFEVPTQGYARIAVPADRAIARVICEFDQEAHLRSADPLEVTYTAPFLFEVGDDVKKALEELRFSPTEW